MSHRPIVVLVHGFPHTPAIWREVKRSLAGEADVHTPALPWLSPDGPAAMDADSLARRLERTIHEIDGQQVDVVVGADAGVPPTVLLALRRPELVRRLVVIESTLGTLPGADAFFAGGAPWWFGFHAVPGLAEQVLAGHEADYAAWFLDQGTRHDLDPSIRQEISAAYGEPGVLARALEYYRALPASDRQLADVFRDARLTVPTIALGAAPVGRALEGQLTPVTDTLTGHLVEDSGHIVPLDRPDVVVDAIRTSLAGSGEVRGTS